MRELLLADPLAVDLDDVPRGDERVQLAALPVHRHPALLDQLVGGAARRDAGPGEIAIEAHQEDCRLLSRAVRDYTDLTRRLADLIVGYGANVQPGQLVGVTSYVGKEELTREIARAAYERGARYVDVLYWDQLGQAPAAPPRRLRRRSPTSPRGCTPGCGTSPTSMPPGSR